MMKSKIQIILISIFGVFVAACEQTSTGTAPEPEMAVATVEIPKYSAEAFFETTSFRLVGSSGYAFSPDGKAVLMSSDKTGVFNVYSLGFLIVLRDKCQWLLVESSFQQSYAMKDHDFW